MNLKRNRPTAPACLRRTFLYWSNALQRTARPRRHPFDVLRYRFLKFTFAAWAMHCKDLQAALQEMAAELPDEPEHEASPTSTSSTAQYRTPLPALAFDGHIWHRLAAILPSIHLVACDAGLLPHKRSEGAHSPDKRRIAPHRGEACSRMDFWRWINFASLRRPSILTVVQARIALWNFFPETATRSTASKATLCASCLCALLA